MTAGNRPLPRGLARGDGELWASAVDGSGRALHLGALGRLSCLTLPQLFQECCILILS